MSAQDLEQRARELLVLELDRAGLSDDAEHIRAGRDGIDDSAALRAIVAALRQQPAPAIIDNAGEVASAEPVAYIYQERYGHKDEAWIERIERALPVWEHRNVIPLYAAPHKPAPVVDDAMVNRAVAATSHPRNTCLDHYEYAEAVIVAALARAQGVQS